MIEGVCRLPALAIAARRKHSPLSHVDRMVRLRLPTDTRTAADRHDRRQVRLALTETGSHLVDAVSARRLEIAELLKGIPRETQLTVVNALTQLTKSAGELPEQDRSTGWDL